MLLFTAPRSFLFHATQEGILISTLPWLLLVPCNTKSPISRLPWLLFVSRNTQILMSMLIMDFPVNNSLSWVAIISIAAIFLWELFSSPLRAFPGPLAARFTNIWRAIATASGHIDRTNVEWHRKYGSAVRVGPNTISISDPNLIRVIYATKTAWPKVPPAFNWRFELFLTGYIQEWDVQTEWCSDKWHEAFERVQYPRQCLAWQIYEAHQGSVDDD